MPRFAAPNLTRSLCAAAVLVAAVGGSFAAAHSILPADGSLAAGLRVGGEPVLADQSALAVAQDRAATALARKVSFRWGDNAAVTATLAELGAEVDTEMLARRLAEVGHDGDIIDRLHESLAARE